MIPIVDLSSDDAPRQIRTACESVGFFYLREHGIPDAVRRDARAASETFFNLPEDEKARVAVDARHRGYVGMGEATLSDDADTDFKESFIWSVERDLDETWPLEGPNQWQADRPEIARALTAYLGAVMTSGMKLLARFADCLGQPSDFYESCYRKPLARGSIIHYPPSTTHRYGTSQHTDYGAITLLWQDDVGGLQVEAGSGEWTDVSPIPDTLVVNIGDLMTRWTASTGNRFRSTNHRVLSHASRDRYSMAVFFDPDYDTVIDGITCGEYILSRFDDVFAYRSKK